MPLASRFMLLLRYYNPQDEELDNVKLLFLSKSFLKNNQAKINHQFLNSLCLVAIHLLYPPP